MNNNKPRHAKEIVSTALKIAKEINLPKAAIAVFDEEGEMLDIGTYGKSEEKAESDCRMKMKDLSWEVTSEPINHTGPLIRRF